MRKEVLIAIILGLILGSILVYGIYTANKATSGITQTQNDPNIPTPSPETKDILTISSPLDGDIFSSPIATISGQTDSSNSLVIVTETEQLLPEIVDNKFSSTIDLIKGGNLIQITSITPTGQRQDIYLNLVFTDL